MYSKNLETYKKSLILTQRQKDVLVGLLLGDGCLEVLPKGNTARLKIEYSSKQKTYIEWVYEIFRRWVVNTPKRKITHVFGHIYEKYWFTTLSSPLLKIFSDLFYYNHRKIIPANIGNLLTPLGLAVWFMDDGSTKSRESNGRILCTHAFSYKEVLFLCDMLKRNFFLKATPRRQKDGIEIYISGHSGVQLRNIIEPYIVFSMRYKLP